MKKLAKKANLNETVEAYYTNAYINSYCYCSCFCSPKRMEYSQRITGEVIIYSR